MKDETRKLIQELGTDEASFAPLLSQLMRDVRGDRSISDAHPRFSQHVSLLTWAEETIAWVNQATIDEAGISGDDQMNSLTRAIIRTVRSEWM